MNIRKEDCNEETINRIADRSLPYIKAGTITPEIAARIIEEEYIRQLILTGENIIFPNKTEKRKKENRKRCNKCKHYEGVKNVKGHAPCGFWKIGGVMWYDYCSRFEEGKKKDD